MEAYNRGDRDAWFLLNDPELEFRPAEEWPESGLLIGREQVWEVVPRARDLPRPLMATEAGMPELAERTRCARALNVVSAWLISTT